MVWFIVHRHKFLQCHRLGNLAERSFLGKGTFTSSKHYKGKNKESKSKNGCADSAYTICPMSLPLLDG